MDPRLSESEPLQTGLRRLSLAGIDSAVSALDEVEDRDVAIHTLRKQCKKSRALLRLFSCGLGPDWRAECRFFRDLSRSLSAARDAKVILDVHATLLERYGALLVPSIGSETREKLIGHIRSQSFANGQALSSGNGSLRQQLLSARLRARGLRLAANDTGILKCGLLRAYRRGRNAAKRVAESGAREHFHELRKRGKDYWCQLELVAKQWPEAAMRRIGPTRKLTELLGEMHDLDIYCAAIEPMASTCRPMAVEILAALARRQISELEPPARSLAFEVFAAKPKQFAAELDRPRTLQQVAG